MARSRLLKRVSPTDTNRELDRCDPLVAAVEDWRERRSRLDAMIIKWQGLEDALSRRARAIQVSLSDAYEGEMPEALQMRALDRKIGSSHGKLANQVSQIRRLEAKTVDGAIAKMSLGLLVQGKYDWQSDARELIEEGIAALQSLAASRTS